MTREDFKPLIEFAMEHYPPALTLGEEKMLDWVCWAADKDFLFTAYDTPDKIAGVAIARPVSEIPEKESEYDENGDIIYVDVMVAPVERAFQLLGLTILNHFKQGKIVSFQRLHRGDKRKIYPAKHCRRTLLKLKYG